MKHRHISLCNLPSSTAALEACHHTPAACTRHRLCPHPPQLRDNGCKVGALSGVLVPAALHERHPSGKAGEGAGAWQIAVGRWLGQGRAVAAHHLAHDLCICGGRASGSQSETGLHRVCTGAVPRVTWPATADGVRAAAQLPEAVQRKRAGSCCPAYSNDVQRPICSPSRSGRCPTAAARS